MPSFIDMVESAMFERMRILHVNKFFDLTGGTEMYLHRLMRAQHMAGHEAHVLATCHPDNLPNRDSGLFVAYADLKDRKGIIEDTKTAANFLWNREAKEAMMLALQKYRPDVVHVHNIYHHLSSSVLVPIRRRHVPCVQTLHDYKLICPNYRLFTEGATCERCKGGNYLEAIKHRCLTTSLLPNVVAALEMGMTKARQSYEKTVQLFLCPSHFLFNKMRAWGEPESKLRWLANPAELRPEVAPRGGGYILYAGRLAPEKGLMSFVEAAAQVPDMPIKIAGRGSEETKLRQIIEKSGAAHIELLGFVAPEALDKIRARAEAVVLPAIWYENAPLAILEAMGDGIPCMVSAIGGLPELVENGVHGYLAEPGSVESWLEVLRKWQATALVRRDEMAKACRKKISEEYSWSVHLSALERYYHEASNA